MPEAVTNQKDRAAGDSEGRSVRTLIAIPVFNEIGHVGRMLPAVREHTDLDVLFIDDASTDGTGDLLDSLASGGRASVLRHVTNKGYGRTLIDAFDWADQRGYDWVITMDCDEQHEPSSIPAFLNEIAQDEADLISGTRYFRAPGQGEQDLPPPERRAVNLLLTTTINTLFGWSLTDTFCGFKAHRVAPTVEMRLSEPGYAFPMQLWPRVFAGALRVREIPVRRIYNDPNRTFGHDVRAGDLDNARTRLIHYLTVLHDELCDLNLPPLRDAVAIVARDSIDVLPDTLEGDLRDTLRSGLETVASVPC